MWIDIVKHCLIYTEHENNADIFVFKYLTKYSWSICNEKQS